MRLFTGLDLPAEVVQGLEGLVGDLRPRARIQWSRPANLHITTKFIGEWPREQLDELKDALGGLPSRPALEVRIRELGFFPNPQEPRIFWCGVEAAGIAELAAATDRATARLGIAKETRPFSPHLTLARIKERPDLGPLRARLDALPLREFGQFRANGFFLYLSELHPSGSVYTKLAEFPITK